MRHRFSLPLVLVSLLVVAAAGWQARTLAQVRVGSDGRALDSNLMLGSGGYNPRTPTRGVGMNRSIYRVSRTGEMRYNRHAAFGGRRLYSIDRTGGQTARAYQYRGTYQRTYRGAGRPRY